MDSEQMVVSNSLVSVHQLLSLLHMSTHSFCRYYHSWSIHPIFSTWLIAVDYLYINQCVRSTYCRLFYINFSLFCLKFSRHFYDLGVYASLACLKAQSERTMVTDLPLYLLYERMYLPLYNLLSSQLSTSYSLLCTKKIFTLVFSLYLSTL